jgi:hypothetical protein
MSNPSLSVIRTSPYDDGLFFFKTASTGVGTPHYTGFNTCEDILGSLRRIRVVMCRLDRPLRK